jgi:hypothetical protein
LSDAMDTHESPSPAAQGAQEESKSLEMPAPTATGNERIAILRHGFTEVDLIHGAEYPTARLELAIRNVSAEAIATAVFEAVFYDGEGQIIDTARQREIELGPETSRLIYIASSIPVYEADQIARYDVRLVKATTTAQEKVQLRRYEIKTTDTGEEEVWGLAKNLSDVKTDAAIVATFYDVSKENIGTRVLVLKDIEPNTVRQFRVRFKPHEGDTVRSFSIALGEITA